MKRLAHSPEVFSSNLLHLMAIKKKAPKQVASDAGLNRKAGYKWLRRAVSQGLKRKTTSNKGYLDRLTRYFGLDKPDDFWDENLIRRYIFRTTRAASSHEEIVSMFSQLLDSGEYEFLTLLVVELHASWYRRSNQTVAEDEDEPDTLAPGMRITRRP